MNSRVVGQRGAHMASHWRIDPLDRSEDFEIAALQNCYSVRRPGRLQLACFRIAIAVDGIRRQWKSEPLEDDGGLLHLRHHPTDMVQKDLPRSWQLRARRELRHGFGSLRAARSQPRPVACWMRAESSLPVSRYRSSANGATLLTVNASSFDPEHTAY